MKKTWNRFRDLIIMIVFRYHTTGKIGTVWFTAAITFCINARTIEMTEFTSSNILAIPNVVTEFTCR